MKNEIMDLERDFSNNEYFGTNVWTEEKYRVLSGSLPVILSAPHSVNQIRGDEVRDAEKYTGSIVRYLSRQTDSYAIFELFTHADPNNDEDHNYKTAIINLIENYDLKLLIDIHSSPFKDDSDMDIVTNLKQTLCGNDFLLDQLLMLGEKHNLKVAQKNVPNKDYVSEIISSASLLCGIPSIRIILNSNKIDIEKDEIKFDRVLNLLTDFINYFKSVK